jgi:hypothetical protein
MIGYFPLQYLTESLREIYRPKTARKEIRISKSETNAKPEFKLTKFETGLFETLKDLAFIRQ